MGGEKQKKFPVVVRPCSVVGQTKAGVRGSGNRDR